MIKKYYEKQQKVIQGQGLGLGLELGLLHFILNLPPLTRDVKCSRRY